MTCSPVLKKLDDSSLIHFDGAYMRNERLQNVMKLITAQFPEGRFSILDVGGGNGRFVDTLLEHYPDASATLIDNAEVLLNLNKPDARKTIIRDSVENLDANLRGSRFDLICFIFVLHHFVAGSYAATREYQENVLSKVREFLSPRGRIFVLEDIYEGSVIPGLPSRLIYHVTSSSLLKPLARRLGGNTAGVGVCFLNRHQWEGTFHRARLEVLDYHPYSSNKVAVHKRLGLHIKSMRAGHFWLKPAALPA